MHAAQVNSTCANTRLRHAVSRELKIAQVPYVNPSGSIGS